MLPSMKYADRITKTQQVKFGGLNRTAGATDGELYAMRNLTSDHFPVLASRCPRVLCRTLNAPGGLFSWEGLCWVDGTSFYFDGHERGWGLTEGKKSFASLGAYIVIFPDKCWFNVNTGAFGSLESRWEGQSLSFGDGMLGGERAEANAIQCEGVNWEDYFNPGDAVTISGCTKYPGNNKTIIIREIDGDYLYFLENSFTFPQGGVVTETGEMCIERTVPELKYVCENEGRLWGCTDTTIYACKLNDIFNWNSQDGLDDDAFAVDTGSAGVFTGCISFRGYPTFFKEDHIYKVYGSFPSNFEVLGSSTLGLLKGCSGSLAIAGETLFYLSRNGIMAYSGGIPQPMGAAFGTEMFQNAVGGSDGLKYYVSMQGTDGTWGLYVYDTQSGFWCQEDQTQAVAFARCGGELYMLNERGQLWIVSNPRSMPEDAEAEGELEWEAEFADFTDESPGKKGLSKLQIRLELDPGSTVKVWLQFDSDGVWWQVRSTIGEGKKRSYYLPIIPRRADHYRLKLTGTGGFRIYSLTREFYVGSEL